MKTIDLKFLFTIFLLLFLTQSVSAQWNQLNVPSIDYNTLLVTSDGNSNNYIFAGSSGMGVIRSSNYGENWISLNGTDSILDYGIINALGIVPNNSSGNTILAGNWGLGVYQTTDYGINWNFCGIGNHEVISFATSPDGSQVFAGTRDDGIYHSTNAGLNWTKIGLASNAVYAITVIENDLGGISVFAGTWYTGLYRLDYNGASWSVTGLGYNDNFIMALTSVPDGLGGTSIYAGYEYGIITSNNNGLNWSPLSINTGVTCILISDTNFFAATTEGVFVSNDNGLTWHTANEDLTNLSVTSLAIAGDYLFAATAGEVGPASVWRRPLSELITTVGINDYSNSSYTILDQNYPNPVSNVTTISFAIQEPSFVTLKIYDMLVKELQTFIANEFIPGNYSHQIDLSDMPNGTYFYTLQTNTDCITKKLTIIK